MKIQRICDIAGTLYFLSAHWCYYLSLFKIKVHLNTGGKYYGKVII